MEQFRGRAQSRDAPEVVPVIEIVRSEVLRAETRRQQSRFRPAGVARQPLADDPTRAAGGGAQPGFVRRLAGQRGEPLVDPDRLAVGIPFALLRKEVAIATLPRRKMAEHPPRALHVAEREQHMQHEGGVAEPKTLVRVRPRIGLVGRVQDKIGHRKIVEPLQTGRSDRQLRQRGQRRSPRRASRDQGALPGRKFVVYRSPNLECCRFARAEIEECDRRRHADGIRRHSRIPARLPQAQGSVALLIRRQDHPRRLPVELHRVAAVNLPAGVVRRASDLLHETDALGIIWPQSHGEKSAAPARRLNLYRAIRFMLLDAHPHLRDDGCAIAEVRP